MCTPTNNPMDFANILNSPSNDVDEENEKTRTSIGQPSSVERIHQNERFKYEASNHRLPRSPPSDWSPSTSYQQPTSFAPEIFHLPPMRLSPEEPQHQQLSSHPPIKHEDAMDWKAEPHPQMKLKRQPKWDPETTREIPPLPIYSLPSPPLTEASYRSNQLPPPPVINPRRSSQTPIRQRPIRAPATLWPLPLHQLSNSQQQQQQQQQQYQYRAPTPSPFNTCTSRCCNNIHSTSPPPSPPAQPNHSNKAYTPEQVCFIRYQKEDVGIRWEAIKPIFFAMFPETLRDSGQCFSSRYYRDNWLPLLDALLNPTYDAEGKVATAVCKVRERALVQWKGAPHSLVEKQPWEAVKYSWVNEEHRKRARQIMERDAEDEKMGRLSVKGKWRRAIRIAEVSKEASRKK